jgi:hypothetical protein
MYLGLVLFAAGLAMIVAVGIEELEEKNRQTRSKAIPANSPRQIATMAIALSALEIHKINE